MLHDGLLLPPPGIPRHGSKDNDEYVKLARLKVRLVQDAAGLTANDRVLDIGCGAGVFLTGMIATFGRADYIGLDVRRKVIDWCRDELADPSLGKIRFEWINVENPRYNNAAEPQHALAFRLPVADRSVDVTVLYSVFTHMTHAGTGAYLKEIARVLDHGGRCFCTAFVEDGVETWTENPENYIAPWKGPLHCARFNREAFDKLVADAGLTIRSFEHHAHPGGQSAYVLVPADVQ